jgi:hypothetical protein
MATSSSVGEVLSIQTQEAGRTVTFFDAAAPSVNEVSLSNARALLVPIGRVLRDLHGDTPRSGQEGPVGVRRAVVFEFT